MDIFRYIYIFFQKLFFCATNIYWAYMQSLKDCCIPLICVFGWNITAFETFKKKILVCWIDSSMHAIEHRFLLSLADSISFSHTYIFSTNIFCMLFKGNTKCKRLHVRGNLAMLTLSNSMHILFVFISHFSLRCLFSNKKYLSA